MLPGDQFRQLFSVLPCQSLRHLLSVCLCIQAKFNQQFCQLFPVFRLFHVFRMFPSCVSLSVIH